MRSTSRSERSPVSCRSATSCLATPRALQGYLNSRLTLFVKQEEENQLLNGKGSGTDLDGLLNRVPNANQDVVSGAAAATALDHIFAAITVAEESFLPVDGIVINPSDWADIRLAKDKNENYLAGSPFSNGGGQPSPLLFDRRCMSPPRSRLGHGAGRCLRLLPRRSIAAAD